MIISMVEAYGQLGLFLVMILQTIIVIIPSEGVLVFAGAIGIPLIDIVIYGGSGLIAGSVIAFFLARWGGRPIVERMLGEKWTTRIDGWVVNHGGKAILLTRLVPVMPFDLISYISGVTPIKFRTYIIATVLGAFPRCLMLAFLGAIGGDFLKALGFTLDLIFVLGICGMAVLIYLDRKGCLSIIWRKLIKVRGP